MIFGVAKAISREHDAMGKYDVLIVDLGEVPVLGVTSSLAIENAIQEATEDKSRGDCRRGNGGKLNVG